MFDEVIVKQVDKAADYTAGSMTEADNNGQGAEAEIADRGVVCMQWCDGRVPELVNFHCCVSQSAGYKSMRWAYEVQYGFSFAPNPSPGSKGLV